MTLAVVDHVDDPVRERALDAHYANRPGLAKGQQATAADYSAWLIECQGRADEAKKQIQLLGPKAFLEALEQLGFLTEDRWSDL